MDLDYGTVTDHWWGDYDIGKGVADGSSTSWSTTAASA
jgi:hypothetical protein